MSLKERINILITGTPGAGKSTLVEALVGKSASKTGSQLLRVGSKIVTEYQATPLEGKEVVVWKSTGLRDRVGDEEYIAELKEKCIDVNVVIYCIDITATRSSGTAEVAKNDLSALKKLTTAFGLNWWNRSIFVMTRANDIESALKGKRYPEKRFNDRLQDWKKQIHAILIRIGVPKEVAYKIPIEPAGDRKKPRLPGRENWLSALWCVIRTSAMPPSTTTQACTLQREPLDQGFSLLSSALPPTAPGYEPPGPAALGYVPLCGEADSMLGHGLLLEENKPTEDHELPHKKGRTTQGHGPTGRKDGATQNHHPPRKESETTEVHKLPYEEGKTTSVNEPPSELHTGVLMTPMPEERKSKSLVGKATDHAGPLPCICWTDKEVKAEESVEVVIWESPTLQDGSVEQNLAELNGNCNRVNIYCIDMSTTHSSEDTKAEIPKRDCNTIRKLTKVFGPNWWKRSIFVITHANILQSGLQVKSDVEKRFNDRVQEWKEQIHAMLLETGVPKQIAYKIPVEPAGNINELHLPGRENWLSSLWHVILTSATQLLTTEKGTLPYQNPENQNFNLHGNEEPCSSNEVLQVNEPSSAENMAMTTNRQQHKVAQTNELSSKTTQKDEQAPEESMAIEPQFEEGEPIQWNKQTSEETVAMKPPSENGAVIQMNAKPSEYSMALQMNEQPTENGTALPVNEQQCEDGTAIQMNEQQSKENTALQMNEQQYQDGTAIQMNVQKSQDSMALQINEEDGTDIEMNEQQSEDGMAMLLNEQAMQLNEKPSVYGTAMQGHELLCEGGVVPQDYSEPQFKERLDIIITGTPGVGKSTLVDAFVGHPVTKGSSQLQSTARENVTGYKVTAEEGVEVVVWDSHSLHNDLEDKENGTANIKETCSKVKIVIYCMDISATRSSGLTDAEVAENDLSTMRWLTSSFGYNWWKRSIFVMTRANVLETALKVKPNVEKRFNDRLQDWKERIHATLIETGVPKEIAHKIPIEPAGHRKKPRLAGRENWLSSLWHVILTFGIQTQTAKRGELQHENHEKANEQPSEKNETLRFNEPSSEEKMLMKTNRPPPHKVGQTMPENKWLTSMDDTIQKCEQAPEEYMTIQQLPEALQKNEQTPYDGVAREQPTEYGTTMHLKEASWDNIAIESPTRDGEAKQINEQQSEDGTTMQMIEEGTAIEKPSQNWTGYELLPEVDVGTRGYSEPQFKERLDILITGTPGVGKSTLVDAFVGHPVTKGSSQLQSTARENVTGYKVTAEEGVEVVVWDSHSLHNDLEEDVTNTKEMCDNVNVVIYCMDISATRSSGLTAAEVAKNDLSAMRWLTSSFGYNWWKRSIFVMTRANVLETALKVKPNVEKRFNDRLQDWKERIHATLIETGVPKEIAHKIPIEPAGHRKKPRLAGRENWLSSLWHVILTSATQWQTEEKGDLLHQNPENTGFNLHGYEQPCKKNETLQVNEPSSEENMAMEKNTPSLRAAETMEEIKLSSKLDDTPHTIQEEPEECITIKELPEALQVNEQPTNDDVVVQMNDQPSEYNRAIIFCTEDDGATTMKERQSVDGTAMQMNQQSSENCTTHQMNDQQSGFYSAMQGYEGAATQHYCEPQFQEWLDIPMTGTSAVQHSTLVEDTPVIKGNNQFLPTRSKEVTGYKKVTERFVNKGYKMPYKENDVKQISELSDTQWEVTQGNELPLKEKGMQVNGPLSNDGKEMQSIKAPSAKCITTQVKTDEDVMAMEVNELLSQEDDTTELLRIAKQDKKSPSEKGEHKEVNEPMQKAGESNDVKPLLEQPLEIEEVVNRDERKKTFEILITGTTGRGKSTLIDALTGKPITRIANQLLCVQLKSVTHNVSVEEAAKVPLGYEKQHCNLLDVESPYKEVETIQSHEQQYKKIPLKGEAILSQQPRDR